MRVTTSSAPATACHQRRSSTSSRYRSFHSRRASTYGLASLMSTPFRRLEGAPNQFAYQLRAVERRALELPRKSADAMTIGFVGEGNGLARRCCETQRPAANHSGVRSESAAASALAPSLVTRSGVALGRSALRTELDWRAAE